MLENIPLSYYALAGLLNFITSAVLAIFVFSRNPKSRINQIFSLFAFTVAGWSLCYFLWLRAGNGRLAEVYLRTLMLFVIFIPTTFTHFILTLLKVDVDKRINLSNYLVSSLLGLTVYTRLFASDIGPFLVFPYWLKPGILFSFHATHFFANVIYSHFLMLRTLKRGSAILRNQVRYVLIGTAIGYISGAINYLTWYRIPIPPFLNPLVSLYVGTVTYAIIRHQLLDIEVVIKRTVVFAGLVASVVAVVSLMAFVSQDLLARVITIPRWLSNVLAAAIIAAVYGPLRNWLVNVTDRYLFQKKYDYKELLRTFTDEVVTVLDLRQLVEMTVERLASTIKLEACALLLLNRERRRYEIAASRGVKEVTLSINEDDALIALLRRTQDPVLRDAPGKMPDRVEGCLDQLHATVCLPLVLHDELIGLLCLGKKKSDEEYTKDDLDILMPLAKTEAIAISNAQLVVEVAQKEKLAVIGTLAAAINHEVCNPLNNVKVQSEGFLIKLRKGLFDHLSKEELTKKFTELLQSSMVEVDRSAAITTRLSNFAKPAREPISEAVDIEQAVDEVKALLGHDFELNMIRIQQEIPGGLPPIRADRRQIQEILFNLIRNAGQAIERNGTITVRARHSLNGRVQIEIQDTGCGIPEEHLGKLFTPFFTTKGESQGTGLGLFVAKRLVERNEGTIAANSTRGVGTTFTLEFPAHESALAQSTHR